MNEYRCRAEGKVRGSDVPNMVQRTSTAKRRMVPRNTAALWLRRGRHQLLAQLAKHTLTKGEEEDRITKQLSQVWARRPTDNPSEATAKMEGGKASSDGAWPPGGRPESEHRPLSGGRGPIYRKRS